MQIAVQGTEAVKTKRLSLNNGAPCTPMRIRREAGIPLKKSTGALRIFLTNALPPVHMPIVIPPKSDSEEIDIICPKVILIGFSKYEVSVDSPLKSEESEDKERMSVSVVELIALSLTSHNRNSTNISRIKIWIHSSFKPVMTLLELLFMSKLLCFIVKMNQ